MIVDRPDPPEKRGFAILLKKYTANLFQAYYELLRIPSLGPERSTVLDRTRFVVIFLNLLISIEMLRYLGIHLVPEWAENRLSFGKCFSYALISLLVWMTGSWLLGKGASRTLFNLSLVSAWIAVVRVCLIPVVFVIKGDTHGDLVRLEWLYGLIVLSVIVHMGVSRLPWMEKFGYAIGLIANCLLFSHLLIHPAPLVP